MSLTGIVACNSEGIIGVNGKIPWHYKEDMAFFKFMTIGHTVVMGGATYRSIGKPLKGRKNVVISRKGGVNNKDIDFIDIKDNFPYDCVVKYLYNHDDVFIIGGGEIYEMFRPMIKTWYVTAVNDEVIQQVGDITHTINIEAIQAEYKALAEIKLSESCKVIKYSKD